jgi:ribosomal protein S18 acetylase RimI-like enzyme
MKARASDLSVVPVSDLIPEPAWISLARPKEIDEIAATDEIAMTDSLAGSERRQLIRKALKEKELWVVALGDGSPGSPAQRIVGYAIFDYSFHGHGIFRHVQIAPHYRRRGLGFDLIDGIQAHAKGDRVFASVADNNEPAVHLFDAAGFEIAGTIDHTLPHGGKQIVLVHYLYEPTPNSFEFPNERRRELLQ